MVFLKPYDWNCSCISVFWDPRFGESSSYHTADYQQPFEVPSLDSPAQTIQTKLAFSRSKVWTALLKPYVRNWSSISAPLNTRNPRFGWSSNYTTETAPVSSPYEIPGSNGPPHTIQSIISAFWGPRFGRSCSNHTDETDPVSSPFEIPGYDGLPQTIQAKLLLYHRLLRSQVRTALLKSYGQNWSCINAFRDPRFGQSSSNHTVD